MQERKLINRVEIKFSVFHSYEVYSSDYMENSVYSKSSFGNRPSHMD